VGVSDLAGVVADELQALGYLRLHRAIVRSCGHGAAITYAVLEDIAQIAARKHASIQPHHSYIAEETGRSVAQVRRDLVALRTTGWITWRKVGKSCEFSLTRAHHRYQNERESLSKRARSDTDTSKEQEVSSNARDAHARERAREPTTLAAEMAHPYWHENEKRRHAFEAAWKNWPRDNHSKLKAAQAWRIHVGPLFDVGEADPAAQEFADSFGKAVYDWKLRNEPQFVPHLATWLNHETWRA
jgi:predicted secreted protein